MDSPTTSSLVLQSVAGCLLAVIGMLAGFWLVRLAANAVILLIMVGVCVWVVYAVHTGQAGGWLEVAATALAAGGIGALLCLPVLPFSSLFRKK